jgi:hypothetical protein
LSELAVTCLLQVGDDDLGTSYFAKETEVQREYAANWQTHKPYTTEETRLPCALVSDPNDVSIDDVGESYGSVTTFCFGCIKLSTFFPIII